jgi:hypothetical protein
MRAFRVREGLPAYGPVATPFPPDFGRLGREGFVVEFEATDGAWVGNFRPGLGGISQAVVHPDGQHILVFAGGDVWSVDPDRRDGQCVGFAVDGCWSVDGELVLSRQGLAFFRIGRAGIVWHTRRLSWDGFDDVRIVGSSLHAVAWSPLEDRWMPCSVDLRSGRSNGGSFGIGDPEGWEQLANGVPG